MRMSVAAKPPGNMPPAGGGGSGHMGRHNFPHHANSAGGKSGGSGGGGMASHYNNDLPDHMQVGVFTRVCTCAYSRMNIQYFRVYMCIAKKCMRYELCIFYMK